MLLLLTPTEKNTCGIERFPCGSTAFLSVLVLKDKKYHNTGNAVHWNFTHSA